MKRRILALILSFVYCGLGQIYKGQVIKGIDFIIIYTILIVASFHPWSIFHLLGLTILPFVWFVGIMDAYMYEQAFIDRRKWLLIILPGVFMSLMVFLILFLYGV